MEAGFCTDEINETVFSGALRVPMQDETDKLP